MKNVQCEQDVYTERRNGSYPTCQAPTLHLSHGNCHSYFHVLEEVSSQYQLLTTLELIKHSRSNICFTFTQSIHASDSHPVLSIEAYQSSILSSPRFLL